MTTANPTLTPEQIDAIAAETKSLSRGAFALTMAERGISGADRTAIVMAQARMQWASNTAAATKPTPVSAQAPVRPSGLTPQQRRDWARASAAERRDFAADFE